MMSRTFDCLIIDDEPLAIEVLTNHIDKVPTLRVKNQSTNPLEGIQLVRNETFDLMFLDVEMPELNGIELIECVQNPPPIILTTAHRDYAMDGFDHEVLDFLLKPITFSRFMKSINRFLRINDQDVQKDDKKNKDGDFIYINSNRKLIKIYLDDLVYVEGQKDYVKFQLLDDMYMVRKNIGVVQERLPEDRFVRVHKSFIVSKYRITSISAELLQLGPYEVPIGRYYKNAAMENLSINKNHL